MAKKNPGDILTCDWNPIIGCEKYSEGCKSCWFLDGILPWQQRLGNIPKDAKFPYIFDDRMKFEYIKNKKGIIGVCQHSDLFWEKISDKDINKIFDILDQLSDTKNKYIIWTKRSQRMASIINNRYKKVPDHIACAISIENEDRKNERLPSLLSINGIRIVVAEPMLGPIDLSKEIDNIDWVIVGSETGKNARPINLDWVRNLRDVTKSANKKFFVKQLATSHKDQLRILDGIEWTEFPENFIKDHAKQINSSTPLFFL